jgi:hypothetical protein
MIISNFDFTLIIKILAQVVNIFSKFDKIKNK